MRDEIKKRVLDFAAHISTTSDTVRKTADVFGYSKSTVHVDVSKRLKDIDLDLYFKVKEILQRNFAEKHIRGGQATRKKYMH